MPRRPEDIRSDYESWRNQPHEYVHTEPYRGCGECGYGQGAYFHNSHYIRRFRENQRTQQLLEGKAPNDNSF